MTVTIPGELELQLAARAQLERVEPEAIIGKALA
jgi:hypothetical protein